MAIDVEQQLREYADFLDTTIAAPDLTAIIESAAIVTPVAPIRAARSAVLRRPSVVVAIAVAAVLVALGGLSLLLSGGGGTEPADSPTVTTLAPPGTEATATTVAEPTVAVIPGREGSVIITARWSTSGSRVLEESGGAVESIERVETVWYLDADTWRREVPVWQGDGSTELQGAITVVSEGQRFDYYPTSNTFEITDYTPSPTEASPQIEYDFSFECDDAGCARFGGADLFENCTTEQGVVILGFTTTRYECSRPPEWNPNELETIIISLDADGRTLEGTLIHESESGDQQTLTYEVLSLDTSPEFDPTLFQFDCPTDDCRDVAIPLGALEHPLVGQPVPEVAGSLTDGGTFDIANHKGERVVLLLWASWCPPCQQDLRDLEALSAARPDLTVVTGAVLDTTEGVTALVRDLEINLPVIDLYSRNLENGNYLADVWGGSGIPILSFIDETGIIVAVHSQQQGLEAITQTLQDIGW